MPSLISTPEGIKEIDIFDLLPPDEGEINIYYGRIGNGKTFAGARNIYAELRRGLVVYANWKMDWQGLDETESSLDYF